MNKHFYAKKDDFKQFDGAARHRFNAEYNDELEFNVRKGKKNSKHRAQVRRRQFDESH